MNFRCHKARRLLVFVPPALGFVVTILAGWPGGISPDMANTISEGTYFKFEGHQEPFFGLVWAGVLALFRLPTAVAIFYVLQNIGFWLAFALLAHRALQEGSPLMAVLDAIAGFLPPLFCFVVMVESNIQVGVAWFLALAIACAFPARRALFACIPLIFYGYIARSGMIVAVAPMLFACFLLTAPDLSKLRAAAYCIAGAATFFMITLTVEKLFLGAPTRGHVLSVSELFDMAGIYEKTGTHCVPASVVPASTTAEAIMSEYDPRLVGSIIWGNSKGGFILPCSAKGYARLKSRWIRTIVDHPVEYLEVKARFARLFLMIGVDMPVGLFPEFGSNKSLGLPVPDNPLRDASRQYGDTTATTLLWKGWFWLLVSGLVCAASLALGAARAHAGLAIHGGALCSLVPHLVFGQAAVCRYYFLPYSLGLASLLLLGHPLFVAIGQRWARWRSAPSIADRWQQPPVSAAGGRGSPPS